MTSISIPCCSAHFNFEPPFEVQVKSHAFCHSVLFLAENKGERERENLSVSRWVIEWGEKTPCLGLTLGADAVKLCLAL